MAGPAVVFAYHSAKREVFWWLEDERIFRGIGEHGREDTAPAHSLYARLENFIVHGETFTILEYHPNGFDPSNLSRRCKWWDDQLREQGYDIWYEGEEAERLATLDGSSTS